MELMREVEIYITSIKSENEYLRKTNSELTNINDEREEELKDLIIENRVLREIIELGRERLSERLSERTGYSNLEHLRKRVRRMHHKGLLLMGTKYKCFDDKLIEG